MTATTLAASARLQALRAVPVALRDSTGSVPEVAGAGDARRPMRSIATRRAIHETSSTKAVDAVADVRRPKARPSSAMGDRRRPATVGAAQARALEVCVFAWPADGIRVPLTCLAGCSYEAAMTDRGFTLVELLVAIAASRCWWWAPRWLLARRPAGVHRRARVDRHGAAIARGTDALAAAIASAGGERGIGDDTAPLVGSVADRAAVDRGDGGTGVQRAHRDPGAAGRARAAWPCRSTGSRRFADARDTPRALPAQRRCVRLRCRRRARSPSTAAGTPTCSSSPRCSEPLARHLATGAAQLRLSRRRVGGRGSPGSGCCWRPSRRRAGADAHYCRRGAGTDSRRGHPTEVRRLGRRRRRPPLHASPMAVRLRAVRPAAAGHGRARSGRHLRRRRALHGRARQRHAGQHAGAARSRGGRRGEVRARRFRRWSLVPVRRCARSIRCGPPSASGASTSACTSRCFRRSSADRPARCSRAAAPPLKMRRAGCSTARPFQRGAGRDDRVGRRVESRRRAGHGAAGVQPRVHPWRSGLSLVVPRAARRAQSRRVGRTRRRPLVPEWSSRPTNWRIGLERRAQRVGAVARGSGWRARPGLA